MRGLQISRSILSFESVRNLGLALPGVVDSVYYGANALTLNGHMLACMPVNRSAEVNSAVVSIDLKRRASLLKARPDLYYITDHYAPHAVMLMRLSDVSRDDLQRTLKIAWEYVSSLKAADRGQATKKRTARRSGTAAGKRMSSKKTADRP